MFIFPLSACQIEQLGVLCKCVTDDLTLPLFLKLIESDFCKKNENIQKVKSTADYAPVDTVINWMGCVHEQEKIPKRGEGVKWKEVQVYDAAMCLLCNSLLLNTE